MPSAAPLTALCALLVCIAGVAAVPACRGYMGTLSGHGPVDLYIQFPVGQQADVITCTWVYTGYLGRDVVVRMKEDFFFDHYVFQDRINIYRGINKTTDLVTYYEHYSYQYDFKPALVPAVTIVAHFEPGRRGVKCENGNCNVTLSLTAPISHPIPCVNHSLTMITNTSSFNNWRQTFSPTELPGGYFYPPNLVCRWLIAGVNQRVTVTPTALQYTPYASLTVTDITSRGNYSYSILNPNDPYGYYSSVSAGGGSYTPGSVYYPSSWEPYVPSSGSGTGSGSGSSPPPSPPSSSSPYAHHSSDENSISAFEFPGPISSAEGVLLVEFRTGPGPGFHGFQMDVTFDDGLPELCNGDSEVIDISTSTPSSSVPVIISNEGIGYGLVQNIRFLPSTRCTFPLRGAPDTLITLYGDTGLVYNVDFLVVYDGPNDTSPIIANLTGFGGVDELISTSNEVYLVFTSGAAPNFEADTRGMPFGFALTAEARDPSVATYLIPTRQVEDLPRCPVREVYTMTSSTRNISLGIAFDYSMPYARNMRCSWQFYAPDDYSYLIELNASLGTNDYIYFFAGETDDPVLRSHFARRNKVFSVPAGPLLVVFQSDGSRSTDGWGFEMRVNPIHNWTPCLPGPAGNRIPEPYQLYPDNQYLGYPQSSFINVPSQGWRYDDLLKNKYLSNQDCQWLLDYGDLPLTLFVMTDIAVGDRLILYNGSTTDSPILVDSGKEYFYGNTMVRSPALVRFISDDSPIYMNGWGFKIQVEIEMPFLATPPGHETFVVADNSQFREWEWPPTAQDHYYGMGRYYGVFNRSWTWTYPPSIKNTFGGIFPDIKVGDSVYIYDGASTSAPLICRYYRDSDVRGGPPGVFLTEADNLTLSGSSITIELRATARDREDLFPDGGNHNAEGISYFGDYEEANLPDYAYGPGPGGTYCDYGDIDVTTQYIFDQILDCTVISGRYRIAASLLYSDVTFANLVYMSVSARLDFQFEASQPGVVVSFPLLEYAGELLFNARFSDHILPRLMWASNLYYEYNTAAHSISVPNLVVASQLFLRLNDNVKALNFNKLEVLGNLRMDSFSGINVSMPLLRNINGNAILVYIMGNTQAMSFPNLTTVGGQLQMAHIWYQYNTPCQPLVFPKLLAVMNGLSMSGVEFSTLSFPELTFIGNVMQFQDASLAQSNSFAKLQHIDTAAYTFTGSGNTNSAMGPTLSIPSLRSAFSISITGLSGLQSIDMPNLMWSGFTLTSCAALANINLPRLNSMTKFTLTSLAAINTISLPSLLTGHVDLGTGMRDLSVLDLPKAQFMGIMHLSTTGLSIINAPLLSFIDDIEILDGVMQTISLPSLLAVGTFLVATIPYVEFIDMPKLQRTSEMVAIRDTIVKSVVMPSFAQAKQLAFQNNRELSVIRTCALEYAGQVRLQQMNALSCYDAGLMFEHAAEDYDENLNGCNPSLFGIFGCLSNITIPVDTDSCGWGLDCIQQYMNQAVSDADIVVSIPAGTFTGCAVPLTFAGRRFELRGAGADQTVIDCEGVGSPFATFTSATTQATIVSSITLRNGRASRDGTAVFVQGGSPLFRDVTFVGHSSSGNGGAVAVRGGNPGFVGCSFLGNRAGASGGALFVDSGALMNVEDCLFGNNTALANGGAVAYVGADAATGVLRSNFTDNVAVKGGAIYTEGALALTGVTFLHNHATAFGGACAAVPTQPTGSNLVASEVTAVGNTAGDRGGALFLYSSGLQMTDSELRGNIAGRTGGGIYSQCSESYQTLFFVAGACPIPLSLDDVLIANNTATTGGGGGVYADHVIVDLTDTVLLTNFAGDDGGGVAAVSSNFTGTNSQFMRNQAGRGGALYCEARGTCQLTQSTVSNNAAVAAGGAFFFCVSQCQPEDENTPPTTLQITTTTTSGNTISATGYGPLHATDPTDLTWASAPALQVVSGGVVAAATDKRLRVTIRDGFDQPVLSGDNVLQLSIADETGSQAGITLQGATTIFAPDGNAVFDVTTVIAQGASQLNRAYTVTCKYATLPSVATASTFTLLPCGVGQGVSADAAASTGLVCADCAAGTYANDDTSLPCVPCQPGSYNDATGQTGCQPCAANYFQPASGAASCVACPAGSRSDGGTTECVSDSSSAIIVTAPPDGSLQGGAALYGLIAGIVIFLLIVFAIVARIVYRNARRKTMQQYYLDDDATVRQGADAGLSAIARKLISASTTTRIGGGEFADIYKAKHDGKWIALKVLKNDSASQVLAQREFQREVTALSTLSAYKHPAVIELLFYIERNPMCIAMEFCPEGSLKRQLRELNLNLWDKVRMAAQVASGISLLHKVGIAHMDIKTDNILLVMGEETTDVKICDFGICRNFHRGRSGSGATSALGSAQMQTANLGSNKVHNNPVFDSSSDGSALDTNKSVELPLAPASLLDSADTIDAADAFTPQYIDPYRLLNQHDMSEATLKRADVFAFAMVMWAVYSRAEPFAGIDSKTLIRLRKETPGMRPPAIADCHECYGKLMERAWGADPAGRPSIQECCDALQTCLHDHFSIDLPEAYTTPLRARAESSPLPADEAKIHQMAKAGGGVEMTPLGPMATSNLQTVAPPAPATAPPMSGNSFGSFGSTVLDTSLPPPPPGAPPANATVAFSTFGTTLETRAPPPPGAPPGATATMLDTAALRTVAPGPPPQPSVAPGMETQLMHTQPLFPPQ